MVNHVKNGKIEIQIKINLFESLMIKIKLHFDYKNFLNIFRNSKSYENSK